MAIQPHDEVVDLVETVRLPFDVVYQEHVQYVCRVLRRLGVAICDVDDVTQEVFVVVHRRWDTFNGQSTIRTWIYGITIRCASEYRRRRRKNEAIVHAEFASAGEGADAENLLKQRQARAQLDTLLSQLDVDKRVVFVLYELEALTMAEVAEIVGCPLQTAYSRLRLARQQVESAIRRMNLKVGP